MTNNIITLILDIETGILIPYSSPQDSPIDPLFFHFSTGLVLCKIYISITFWHYFYFGKMYPAFSTEERRIRLLILHLSLYCNCQRQTKQ